ncbi:MAG: putative short-subunit dehydrogenase-like oxidoreductase (DUF2520 family) [Bacteroidia bacterium]|jgi:predicted short-subunit dehydrogenase-like oxidoreductase (DUF2520 family)
MKIAFIGSGNVAWHLAQALDKAGNEVVQILSKTEANAKALAVHFGAHFSTNLSTLEHQADLCLICVGDDQLEEVVKGIPFFSGIIAHTCGPKPISFLSEKTQQYGSFYPLQSFSKNRACDVKSCPFLLEANQVNVLSTLSNLAFSISNSVQNVSGAERLKYHLAAVFANNFTNVMFQLSEQYLQKHNLDFNLLKPIILETGRKIQDLSPSESQTGPAKRHDERTMQLHRGLLQNNPELLALYNQITALIQQDSN